MKFCVANFYEVIRFGIVGVGATAIHYGLYWLLLQIGSHNVAYAVGYGISFLFNLYFTAHFTFKRTVTTKRSMGFFLSHVVNFSLQMGLLNLFIYIGTPEQWAPLPVYALCIPINFLLVRFVFKKI